MSEGAFSDGAADMANMRAAKTLFSTSINSLTIVITICPEKQFVYNGYYLHSEKGSTVKRKEITPLWELVLFLLEYFISRMYSDRQVCEQTMQNAASLQSLHCQPLIQQF